MKSKNVNEYRDEVMTHLEYIKEKVNENHSHLQKIFSIASTKALRLSEKILLTLNVKSLFQQKQTVY